MRIVATAVTVLLVSGGTCWLLAPSAAALTVLQSAVLAPPSQQAAADGEADHAPVAGTTTLRGVLRWKNGAPCAGARLEVRRAAPEAWALEGAPTLGEAFTDADGRYRIQDLATQRVVQLRVRTRNFAPHFPFTVELSSEPEQEAMLDLSRPATLRFVLDDLATRTDLSPRAREGLEATLFTADTFDMVDRPMEEHPDPPYAQLDPAVAYALLVSVPGFEAKWLPGEITVHSGDNTWHGTVGELKPESAAVPPRVKWRFPWSFLDERHAALRGPEANARWTAGRRDAGLVVHARSLDTRQEEDLVLHFAQFGTTLATGMCDVTIAAPIEISVVLNGVRQVLSPVKPGQQVDLVVPLPAGAARVTFLARDRSGARAMLPGLVVKREGSDGGLEIPGNQAAPQAEAWLLPGNYQAFTFGGEFATSALDFTVADNSPRTVELVLLSGGTLRGVVRLDASMTAGEVQVLEQGASLDAPRHHAALRVDGSFEVTGLSPGDRVVTLLVRDKLLDGVVVVSLPATVVSDRITDIRFDLAGVQLPAAELLVRLTTAESGTLSLAGADGSFALSLALHRGRDQRLRMPGGTVRYHFAPAAGAGSTGAGAGIAQGTFEVSTNASAPQLIVDV